MVGKKLLNKIIVLLDCKEKDCAVRCSGVLSKTSNNKKCEWYSTYKAKNKCLRIK